MQATETSAPTPAPLPTQRIDTPTCLLTQVHALHADAAAHWASALRASPNAVQYLNARGIGGAIAARFGLGCARVAWRDLGGVLERHGEDAVAASGLVAHRSGNATATCSSGFDRFRDRIMFPIRTRDGQIAGFGGRLVEPDGATSTRGSGAKAGRQMTPRGFEPPKYLNSPEGIAFDKGRLLYGLFEAETAIKAQGLAVVVEGYLDVVSLAQAGFDTAVATLGTACRREQVAELLTATARIVFCFDADAAGRAAAARALLAALPFATDARSFGFVFLPEGHDPDSFVRVHGLQAFRAMVDGAMPLDVFLVEHAGRGCDLGYAEGRARCASRARELWRELAQGAAREALLEHCAAMLGFGQAELLAMWVGWAKA